MIAEVHAVIVTYYPDARFFTALSAILGQVGRVWVVDNGSDQNTRQRLRSLSTGPDGRLMVILNDTNVGLGKAQNIGISHALRSNCSWVLLLDDDSIPQPDMVSRLLIASQNRLPDIRIGLLCPRLEDDQGTVKSRVFVSRGPLHFVRRLLTSSDVYYDIAFAIASGSLIPAQVLRRVGLMREDYFIDYIDIEFSFRLRREGYAIVAVGDAVLNHRLGETSSRHRFGAERRVRTHSAMRRYYIYRNRIRVWRQFGGRMPAYVIFEWIAVLGDIAKLLALESNRSDKLRAIAKGIVDGLAGCGAFGGPPSA